MAHNHKHSALFKNQNPSTHFSPDQLSSEKIDYKTKTFELIKQVTALQLKNRKNQQIILNSQRQLSNCKRQIEQFFKELKVSSFNQAKIIIIKNLQSATKPNNQIIQQLESIISEYKKLLQSQLLKITHLQYQCKNKQTKLRQLQSVNNQKMQLKQKLALLNKQYNQLFAENLQLNQFKAQVKKKYKDQMQHFDFFQESLRQFHQEIQYYQRQRKQHINTINQLENKLKSSSKDGFFSFGGVSSKGVQTIPNQHEKKQKYQQFLFSQQCLRASIKTLLQENDKLKNTLLLLYQSFEGQLPKQAQLQLKILLKTMQSKAEKDQAQLITIGQDPSQNLWTQ